MPILFWAVLLFVVGACVGSFVNVLVHRVPRDKSIVYPGSSCPACGKPIAWFDNIPLLSWLILKGRCRNCLESISSRYPIIELISAAMFCFLFLAYFHWHLRAGFVDLATDWPTFVVHLALLTFLLACSAIDVEYYMIPLLLMWIPTGLGLGFHAIYNDPLVAPTGPQATAAAVGTLMGLALAVGLLKLKLLPQSYNLKSQTMEEAQKEMAGMNHRIEMLKELAFLFFPLAGASAAYMITTRVEAIRAPWEAFSAVPFVGRIGASLMGYLAGGAIVWGVRILATLAFGREAMGLGDVHFMGAVGAVLGWVSPLIAFFLAPFFGLFCAAITLLSRKGREVPYGPSLAAASLLTMLIYDNVVAYLQPGLEGVLFLFFGVGQ